MNGTFYNYLKPQILDIWLMSLYRFHLLSSNVVFQQSARHRDVWSAPHPTFLQGQWYFFLYPHFKEELKLTHQWVSDRQTSRHPQSCILDTFSRRIKSLWNEKGKKAWSLHVWHSCTLFPNILSGAGLCRRGPDGYEGHVLWRPTLSPFLPYYCPQHCSTMKLRVRLWFSFVSSQCPTQHHEYGEAQEIFVEWTKGKIHEGFLGVASFLYFP